MLLLLFLLLQTDDDHGSEVNKSLSKYSKQSSLIPNNVGSDGPDEGVVDNDDWRFGKAWSFARMATRRGQHTTMTGLLIPRVIISIFQ